MDQNNRKLNQELEDADNTLSRHLEETSMPGTSGFVRERPPFCRPMSNAELGAAIRLRLNCVHKAFDRSLICPGCRIPMTDSDANGHLAGCTRIQHNNSAHAHASMKRAILRLIDSMLCHRYGLRRPRTQKVCDPVVPPVPRRLECKRNTGSPQGIPRLIVSR
jgi:hypothetical protein